MLKYSVVTEKVGNKEKHSIIIGTNSIYQYNEKSFTNEEASRIELKKRNEYTTVFLKWED